MLFEHQAALDEKNLVDDARKIGLDVDRFTRDLTSHATAGRVTEDLVSGVHSGIITTPTFFINGTRFTDTPDAETLGRAVEAALAQSRPAP
jgi:protein-disulfide isomerase